MTASRLPPSPPPPQRRTIRDIRQIMRDLMQAAARQFDVSAAEIVARDRHEPIVEARQWVMFEAHAAGCGLRRIGRELGKRDHTTIMHGVRREAERRAVNVQ